MSDIKLLHGDCIQLIDDIPDESIDLVLTDIPYNISKESRITFMTDRTGRHGIDFGEWDHDFDINKLSVLQKKLCKGGSFISFHAFMQASELQKVLSDLEFKNYIVWEKTNPMPRNPDRRYICNVETASWYVKNGRS